MNWRTCVGLAIVLLPFRLSAAGTSTVYVDAGGSCNGLAPCYTSVQAGLAQVGGGPSVVNVFPGTYAESVDLSLTGSAAAGPVALTVQAVNASGAPAVGGVLISPVQGEAFWNSVDPFPFALTIRGLSVTSPDTDAIDIEGILGVTTLVDVTASGTPFDGIDIRTRNHVTLTRVQALQNGNDGIQIRFEAPGNLTVTNSVANNNRGFGNGDDGFEIDVFDGSVTMTDTTASGNGADGIDIDGAPGAVRIVAVTLTRITASGNGIVGATPGEHDGIDIANARSETTAVTRIPLGNVAITTATARNNQGSGFDIERATGGTYLLANSTVSDNGSDGIQMTLDGTGPASIGPPGFAVNVRDMVAAANGGASGNGGVGIRLWDGRACAQQPPMDIDLQRVTVTGNESGGMDVRASRAVTASQLVARSNGFGEGGVSEGDGLSFGAAPVVTEVGQGPCAPTAVNFSGVITERNAGDGLEINAGGAVTLNGVTAVGNGNALVALVQQDGVDLTHVREPGGPVSLRNCSVNENRDDGVDVTPRGDVMVEICELRSNGVDGFDTAALPANVTGNVALFEVDAVLNRDDGFDVDTAGNLSLQQSTADRNVSDGLFVKRVLGAIAINGSSFTANGQAGIQLRALGAGPHRVEFNDFVGNGFGAANLTSNATLLFNSNYWGSPSGPTHPSNPAGRGDRVYDGATGGIGAVSFAGFIAASVVQTANAVQVPAMPALGLVLLGGLFAVIAKARTTLTQRKLKTTRR